MNLLQKKGVADLGVDKQALFANPSAYLADSTLTIKSNRPILLLLALLVAPPAVVFLFWKMIFLSDPLQPTLLTGVIALLLVIIDWFSKRREWMEMDRDGIRFMKDGHVITTPWSFYNQEGRSDLKPFSIEIPVNVTVLEEISLVRADGKVSKGAQVTANHFKVKLKKERLQLRNFYPLKSADFAELIRRVALTMGHQDA